jgi:hypothetical protein
MFYAITWSVISGVIMLTICLACLASYLLGRLKPVDPGNFLYHEGGPTCYVAIDGRLGRFLRWLLIPLPGPVPPRSPDLTAMMMQQELDMWQQLGKPVDWKELEAMATRRGFSIPETYELKRALGQMKLWSDQPVESSAFIRSLRGD